MKSPGGLISNATLALQKFRNLTRKKRASQVPRALLSYATHKARLKYKLAHTPFQDFPFGLQIEVASRCNLRCPGCVQGMADSPLPHGRAPFMSFDQFREIMETGGSSALNLNFTPTYGESFLNRDIYKMIALAKEYGIRVTVDTNGHFIDAEKVIASGLDQIAFAIDGFSQETYSQYRIRGNLERVLENLSQLSKVAEARGSSIEIMAKYLVNRYSETEFEAAKAYFESLPHVTFAPDIFWIPSPSWDFYLSRRHASSATPELHDRWAPRLMKEFDPYRFDEEEGLWYTEAWMSGFEDKCGNPYAGIYICCSGDAYPCCEAVALEPEDLCLGNVFELGLGKVFNGPKAARMRASYKATGGRFSACATCAANRGVTKNVTRLPGLKERLDQTARASGG